MRPTKVKLLTTFASALAIGLGVYSGAVAHEGHDHGASHGGTLAKTQNYHFEVVFAKDGIKVYPLTAEGKPVNTAGLSATATFSLASPSKPWFSRPLRAAASTPGQEPTPLEAQIDLSKVAAQGVNVAFQVSGMPAPAEPTATFTVPFALATGGEITFTKATAADQKAINVQKVCKVSGEALGSMGVPIKATRGESSTFLCCAACEKKLLAEPDTYLSPAVTAVKATKADERAIAAQKVCPVSGEALGSMGTPIKVTRGTRSIYLCCQNCLKTVLADPDKFLGATTAAK